MTERDLLRFDAIFEMLDKQEILYRKLKRRLLKELAKAC